jgi:hypothetical protein
MASLRVCSQRRQQRRELVGRIYAESVSAKDLEVFH